MLLNKEFHMDRINIFNECINNCINDTEDYKSIVFVGK